MKKRISILLSILLLCTMTVLPVLSASALPAGTTIYLNAYEAGWDSAYIYGWDCGLHGEFIEMEQTDYEGVYSFTLPQSSTDGMQYFFFANKNTWEEQEQTVVLGTAENKNFYTLYSKDDNGKWTGMWSHMVPSPTEPPTDPPTQPTDPPTDPPTQPPTNPPTEPPTEKPYVSAPASGMFRNSQTIMLRTNCYRAAYSLNAGPETTFTDGAQLTFYDDTTLVLKGYDKNGKLLCNETYRYLLKQISGSTIPAGTQIFFDNREAQWTNVYLFLLQGSFYGEFWEMKETSILGIYSLTLPEAVPVGMELCRFVNQPSWTDAKQTNSIYIPSSDVNMVVPDVTGTGNLYYNYSWTYHDPPISSSYVMASPSKSFAFEMDVMLYTNCDEATFSINGVEEAYTDGMMIHITDTSTIDLVGYSADGEIVSTYTCTYTKVGITTVTATVTGGYDGPVYVYLFGGDRIGSAFYLMEKYAGDTYSYSFEGASQVIFTTTNDWATAEKLNSDEPLVAAGTTAHFDLVHS